MNKGSRNMMDKGWQQMSTVLDQEMPQKRRRRGAFWLFLGAGALILLLGVWLVAQPGAKNDQPVGEPLQHQAHASNPEAASPDLVNTEAQPAVQRRNDDLQAKNAEDVLAGQVASGDQPQVDVTSTTQTPSDNSQEVAAQQEQTGFQRSAANPGQGQIATSAKSTSKGDAVVENEAEAIGATVEVDQNAVREAAALDDAQDIEPISSIDEQVSPQPQIQRAMVAEVGRLDGVSSLIFGAERALPIGPDLTAPFRKRLVVSAFTAMHFDEAILMNGAEGGLALTYDLGKRIRLRTGLSYGHYREGGIWAFTGSKRDDLGANMEMDTMNSSGPGATGIVFANEIYNNTVDYDTVRILADRYNYLHLPVMVQYRVTPRIDIGAGVKISRLLSAPSEYAINEQAATFQAADLNRGGSGPNNFLYNYDILRKYDFAPMLSMSWKMGRSSHLDIAYQRGLVPFVDRSDIMNRTDYHESFSVGLRVDLF